MVIFSSVLVSRDLYILPANRVVPQPNRLKFVVTRKGSCSTISRVSTFGGTDRLRVTCSRLSSGGR